MGIECTNLSNIALYLSTAGTRQRPLAIRVKVVLLLETALFASI
jgi:hypothetical protein